MEKSDAIVSFRDHVRTGPRWSDDPQLTREHVFSLLSNRRRRYVFYSLEREGGTATIGDLATCIAAWEECVPVEEASTNQRKVVYNALQQSHLPRLAERCLVVYDRETGFVELTERGAQLDDYLERVPVRDLRWSRLYLGMAGVACALAGALAVGVPTVARVSGEAWFTLLAFALFVVAVCNVSVQRTEQLGAGEEPPEPTGDRRES